MKIALVGDIAFFGRFSKKNNDNVEQYFSDVAQYLSKFDFVIGNLETPFVKDGRPSGAKSAHISSDVQNGSLLKYLNIDAVTLANNHIFDFGKKDFEYTKQVLDDLGIIYFGDEQAPKEIDIAGQKVSLQGFCCYSSNPLGLKKKNTDYGINPLSYPELKQFILEASEKGRLPIAAIHAGQEHVNYPNIDHVKLARQLAEVAEYVFYGHHPHVIQGIERIRNSVLSYSLGNFCFDDVYTSLSSEPLIKQSINNKQSIILELTIANNSVVQVHSEPIFIGEKALEIGTAKTEKIPELQKEYNSRLAVSEAAYTKKRAALISEYINNRKSKRDLQWYLRRLNFTSYAILRNAYLNKRKYKKLVQNYI